MRSQHMPQSDSIHSRQSAPEPVMPVLASERLPFCDGSAESVNQCCRCGGFGHIARDCTSGGCEAASLLEQEVDSNDLRQIASLHKAGTSSQRNVPGPPERESIDETLACQLLIGLGASVVMLVVGSMIYFPEATIMVNGARTWEKDSGLRVAHSLAEAVTTTVTETITASPIYSTSAAGVTTAARTVLIDATATPNIDSGIMFLIFKFLAAFLIFVMVAGAILLILVVVADSLTTESRRTSTVPPTATVEQPVVDPREVPAGSDEREHPIAGIWARQELQVAERRRREQQEFEEWKQREWEKGRADRMCRERIERIRPPPGYDEAVRSAGVVLDYMRAFEGQGGGLDAFEPPHGGGGGVQWLGGTDRRLRP